MLWVKVEVEFRKNTFENLALAVCLFTVADDVYWDFGIGDLISVRFNVLVLACEITLIKYLSLLLTVMDEFVVAISHLE